MIAYLRGMLVDKSSEDVVVEVGGIGYRLFMPSSSLAVLGKTGEQVQVYTHLQVREDVLNLYGFAHKEEVDFFLLLLQVSGIGPKVALAILSSFPLATMRQAILDEDTAIIAKAPGVGKKTAQRLVLELKDKLKKAAADQGLVMPEMSRLSPDNTMDDTLAALEALGYNAQEVSPVLLRIKQDVPECSTQELLKLVLKNLSAG